jgi:hypothetical protein
VDLLGDYCGIIVVRMPQSQLKVTGGPVQAGPDLRLEQRLVDQPLRFHGIHLLLDLAQRRPIDPAH